MPIFLPNYKFKRITEVTQSFLEDHGIKGLVLDVDNTLTTHDNPTPQPDIEQWLNERRENAMPMIIVSNNVEERVKNFAEILHLPYVSAAGKPLKKGFKQAAAQMGLANRQIAVVGDQIFTDILGANLFGALSIMVEPLGDELMNSIKFKRKIEKVILKVYRER